MLKDFGPSMDVERFCPFNGCGKSFGPSMDVE
jgi:hypothetical protein